MAVHSIDENLTSVLLSATRTCFMSYLLFLVLVLVSRELVLVLVSILVLELRVLTTSLYALWQTHWCGVWGDSRWACARISSAWSTETGDAR